MGDEEIALTRKEYELLLYFISNKNRVVTKEAIVEHLWGSDMEMAIATILYTRTSKTSEKSW